MSGDGATADDGRTPSRGERESAERPGTDHGPAEHGSADDSAVARADAGVPDWDDEYLDRVSDRLFTHFDLEKDARVRGEPFDMRGTMEIHTQKQLLHPALSFAHHVAYEHLFARRETPDVATLERLVELGHDLADERIEADEEHYGTEFSFVLVAEEITEPVREFVSGFRERTMLKYGYNGHYEIHLVVVAPENEDLVASRRADVHNAFRLWDGEETRGLLGRVLDRFV
jgi:hypothetical protein